MIEKTYYFLYLHDIQRIQWKIVTSSIYSNSRRTPLLSDTTSHLTSPQTRLSLYIEFSAPICRLPEASHVDGGQAGRSPRWPEDRDRRSNTVSKENSAATTRQTVTPVHLSIIHPCTHSPDGPSRPATTSSIFSFHCVLFTVRWTAAGSVHPHQSMMSSIHRLGGHPLVLSPSTMPICHWNGIHNLCNTFEF